MTATATTSTIVPDFETDGSAGRKLAVICSQGGLDMAYPGLILANAALGEGIETHVFFTFAGLDMITSRTMGDLQLSTAQDTVRLQRSIAEVGAPEIPEFVEQVVASGGHLWACRMSTDMNHLTAEELFDGVEGIISASDFIDKTDGAQYIFI